jgi:hypothetical protein
LRYGITLVFDLKDEVRIFLFDWSQTFHEIIRKKIGTPFVFILTEAFEKLNYLSSSLHLCYRNNVILSEEEDTTKTGVGCVIL